MRKISLHGNGPDVENRGSEVSSGHHTAIMTPVMSLCYQLQNFFFNYKAIKTPLSVGGFSNYLHFSGRACVRKSGGNISSVAQPCPTLCDPLNCSPPGSPVHGILQARIQEWPFPPPGDLSGPEMEPTSPALAGGFLTAEPLGRPAEMGFSGFPIHPAPHNRTPGITAFSSGCALPLANQRILFISPPKRFSSVSLTASRRPLPGNDPYHLTPQSSI